MPDKTPEEILTHHRLCLEYYRMRQKIGRLEMKEIKKEIEDLKELQRKDAELEELVKEGKAYYVEDILAERNNALEKELITTKECFALP